MGTTSVYEASEVDVTINVDDTMCKGVESWAWYGLQPINQLTKSNGTLMVTSRQDPDSLIEDIHQKDGPYNLGIVTGTVSYSGLWVYKDDYTDVRILGALAGVCPQLVSLDSMVQVIREQWNNDAKVASAEKAFNRIIIRPVEPGEGQSEVPYTFELPGWKEMEEGVVIQGYRARRRVPRRRWRLRTGPERGVQKVQYPVHAAGYQL